MTLTVPALFLFYTPVFCGNGRARKDFKDMKIETLKKGDIMWATDKKNHRHPIIFLQKIDENSFEACIMSTKKVGRNIKMDSSFFEIAKKKESYLVTEYRFKKENTWVSVGRKCNRLTDKGIEFIEEQTKNAPCIYCPIEIKEYKKRNKQH